jgi:rsbT co-antagonist protein RsbR
MTVTTNDETTLRDLQGRLAAARTSLDRTNDLFRLLFEESPDGVVLLFPDGVIQTNARAGAILKLAANPPGDDPDAWKHQWGFFRQDGSRYESADALPGFRAMRGERIDGEVMRIVFPESPDPLFIRCVGRPLPGGGAILLFRDVTREMLMEEEISERRRELALRDDENAQLVDRLRAAMDEIATPVLRVARGVLVVPLIGVVDGDRSTTTAERILGEVARLQARVVILEVTGVDVIDTTTADLFGKITRAVRLLGARMLLSGIRPAVARTLVEAGVPMEGLPSFPSLKHALRTCVAADASASLTA